MKQLTPRPNDIFYLLRQQLASSPYLLRQQLAREFDLSYESTPHCKIIGKHKTDK